MTAYQPDRLFDLEPSPARPSVFFYGGHMAGACEPEQRAYSRNKRAITTGVEAAATKSASEWQVQVICGADHSAPWEDGRDDPEARAWVRSKFIVEVDALIIVLYRESVGCGRELALALALGIPTLVLVHNELEASLLSLSFSIEPSMEREVFTTLLDAEARVALWATRERTAILRQAERRRDWLRSSDPIRRQMQTAWAQLTEPQRDVVSGSAHLEREQIVAVMDDPNEFAAHYGSLIELLHGLGIIARPDPMTGRLSALTTPESEALQAAVEAYDWDAQQVVAAVSAASELIAQGGERRLGLGSPRGWKRILEASSHVRDSR